MAPTMSPCSRVTSEDARPRRTLDPEGGCYNEARGRAEMSLQNVLRHAVTHRTAYRYCARATSLLLRTLQH
eukprot:5534124-Pyramimonas_sp.AAC.1